MPDARRAAYRFPGASNFLLHHFYSQTSLCSSIWNAYGSQGDVTIQNIGKNYGI